MSGDPTQAQKGKIGLGRVRDYRQLACMYFIGSQWEIPATTEAGIPILFGACTPFSYTQLVFNKQHLLLTGPLSFSILCYSWNYCSGGHESIRH